MRTPAGEIDLVARRGRIVAFVEVKARPTIEEARRYLDARALQRVARAAEVLAPRYAREGDDIRIDGLLCAPKSLPRHLQNVWHG